MFSKRIGLLVFALLLTVLLAACGEEGTTTEKADASSQSKNGSADFLKENLLNITDDHLELSKESYKFIADNEKLFPAKDEKTIGEMKDKTDSSVTAKHLNKNATPYFDKIVTFKGTVITVEESDDQKQSYTHVLTDEGNSFEIIMLKSTGDILEEDEVQFWGVPVGPSSFENVSGGATNVQVICGSHIEKR